MDTELTLINLIDVMRRYNSFEDTAFALFGSSIYEDDSTCFHDFQLAQEELTDLFLHTLCWPDHLDLLEDITSPTIDFILNRFYDSDVRSNRISSEDLLQEFYLALDEAKHENV